MCPCQVKLLAKKIREMGAWLHSVDHLAAIHVERDLHHGNTAWQ
jgi:hypothetical protein